MMKRLLFVAVFVSVLFSATLARAATITHNIGTGNVLGLNPFPGFDPALGTLDSVDIALTATVGFLYTNNDFSDQPLVANPQFTFVYFGALTLTDTTSLNVVLIPVQNLPASLGDTESTTLTTGLNIFLGAGDITISADSVLIDPGVDTALSGDVNGFSNMSFLSGTLTYNYTPAEAAVPEPATLTLLGFGLAGMGARRWRQRKP